jgi:hypothetical protein
MLTLEKEIPATEDAPAYRLFHLLWNPQYGAVSNDENTHMVLLREAIQEINSPECLKNFDLIGENDKLIYKVDMAHENTAKVTDVDPTYFEKYNNSTLVFKKEIVEKDKFHVKILGVPTF